MVIAWVKKAKGIYQPFTESKVDMIWQTWLFLKGSGHWGTRKKGTKTTMLLWLYFYTLQSPALYIISTYSMTQYLPTYELVRVRIIIPILQKGTLAQSRHYHETNYL